MKVFKDDVCFLESDDVTYLENKYNFKFNCINDRVYYSYKYNFIKIENKCLVNFLKNENDILNYDYVINLKLDNIDSLIQYHKSCYFFNSLIKYFSDKESYNKEIEFMIREKYKRINNNRDIIHYTEERKIKHPNKINYNIQDEYIEPKSFKYRIKNFFTNKKYNN